MTMRPEPYNHLVDDDAVWNGLEGLERLAEARETTSATLALAWLLAEPRLTGLVTGARRPGQLSEPLAALAAPLTAEDRSELTSLFGGTLSP
jgi:aryl-alcohol dehydrogenase-like predicted oxidoreductase